MKVTYTTSNGRFAVELDSDSQKDAFESIAQFQEVFEESICGKCGSENLRFVVRNVDDNLFYEIRCQDCGARLELGVMKKGGRLYPRRKDKDGNWLPDRGWQRWNSKTKSLE